MYVLEAFVSYLVYNLIFNVKFCERATLSVFNINFCKCDARTRRLASVRLAQAHPNYNTKQTQQNYLPTLCLIHSGHDTLLNAINNKHA